MGYGSFTELKKDNVEEHDFKISSIVQPSHILILAIHGGGIEPGCSELAYKTAELGSCSLYCLEGVKSKGNYDLHIDSTLFDEPSALNICKQNSYTLSYHGYEENYKKMTLVGGRDFSLREKVYEALISAGFQAEIMPDSSPLAGIHPDNIVNKNKRGMGVQLEISTVQRNAFFEKNTRIGRQHTQTEEFQKYVRAVFDAIKGATGTK
ncbi:poly-gamma-glutamate hydrolase family protein [Halobacillus massiliensis]|uniref:poly-gamma-glutamate hydrolase family protein n=1 Tax=Halobacillus massiliensis TaxID=1926286 RepID=UPI0009E2BB82|nr:poly-gamma-glutamate hydrolase family protein [Halobacillus massiliensis]